MKVTGKHETIYYNTGRIEIATYADGTKEFTVYKGIIAGERKEVKSWKEAWDELGIRYDPKYVE